MPQTHRLDPTAILAALGASDATVIAPVSGGADTLIWRVRWRGCDAALRVFRAEQRPVCQKEVCVMRTALAAGIPTPRVLANGIWEDRPALLMSWIEGTPLARLILERPDLVASLGRAMGRVQATIHTLSIGSMPLPNRWLDWVGNGETALLQRLRAFPVRMDRLIHLDYHPLNVMASVDGVTGVLDWANAHAGDPRADLARTYVILRIQPWPGIEPTPTLIRLRRALTRHWWLGYTEAAGLPQDMPLFFAWAGVITQHDLAQHVGKPGVDITSDHLIHIQRWTERWKRRLGLTSAPRTA